MKRKKQKKFLGINILLNDVQFGITGQDVDRLKQLARFEGKTLKVFIAHLLKKYLTEIESLKPKKVG